MSKKVVVILSVLALAFGLGSVGLWYTVNGKIEKASTSLGALSPEFGGATFQSRLGAPAKAAAELKKVRALNADQADDISKKGDKIDSLTHKLKDSETNVADLETQRTDLTRARDDAQGKVDALQTRVAAAESKVKGLEEKLVAQTEESAKTVEDLKRQVDVDKGSLVAEAEKLRAYYSQLYSFAARSGLQIPLGQRPWETSANTTKNDGPRFASNSYVAQIVAFDARQSFLVLNIGPESGISRDQGFDLYIGDDLVGKISITAVLNGSVSTATVAADAKLDKIVSGASVRLVPFGSVAPAVPVADAK